MRLNEYVGLWGRYSLKQGNTLYIFFNIIPIIFVTFIFLFFDLFFKEVIKGKIFWRLNKKVSAYEAAKAWNRGISCNFSQNTDPIVFVLFTFLFFYLLYQKGYQWQYFCKLHLKVLACEPDTAWNRGIPCKILKSIIKFICFVSCFIVILILLKRLSEVKCFEIKWICWPMRKIQPETGEYNIYFCLT